MEQSRCDHPDINQTYGNLSQQSRSSNAAGFFSVYQLYPAAINAAYRINGLQFLPNPGKAYFFFYDRKTGLLTLYKILVKCY